MKAACKEFNGNGGLKALTAQPSALRALKVNGFSDRQIATYIGSDEIMVRKTRLAANITPCVKQIDTLAAEYPAQTNYLYCTYSGSTNDVESAPKPDNRSAKEKGAMVLGCGAYCIGSSVEFDWCAVSAVRQLREDGYKAVVVNYNPETVSTDYDESDRLYFDELSLERVMDIYDIEGVSGIMVSVGGQIPNNLAMDLSKNGVAIMGTQAEDIERAEDREVFSAMLDDLKIDQPKWAVLNSKDQAVKFANKVGFPVLVRPSFVLSGAAMRVATTEEQLRNFLGLAADIAADKYVPRPRSERDEEEEGFDDDI
jgi:carbamoyl-phosphate synthase/aspartate carbamoyltransferase